MSKKLKNQIFGSNDEDYSDDAEDTIQLEISPEQLNIALGRRNESDTYPEQYIDKKACMPFVNAEYAE